MSTKASSGIPMTRNNKLTILQRAREILSVRSSWTQNRLYGVVNGVPQYCLLGAIEQAAYDTGLAQPLHPFDSYSEEDEDGEIILEREELGYRLGPDLRLEEYAIKQFGQAPVSVNDQQGYEKTLQLLDEYINVVRGAPDDENGGLS